MFLLTILVTSIPRPGILISKLAMAVLLSRDVSVIDMPDAVVERSGVKLVPLITSAS